MRLSPKKTKKSRFGPVCDRCGGPEPMILYGQQFVCLECAQEKERIQKGQNDGGE